VITTGLVLPADSRVPATLAVRAAREAEQQPWQESYVSRFVQIDDERDQVAWFHFCTGHHVQFLYWEATLLASERAVTAVQDGDRRAVKHWLARVGTLIRGSGALLHYCTAFDPGRYDPCLRSSMAAERDDFSGDMSRDFLAMMRARARMSVVLDECREQHPDALAVLAQSDAYWRQRHT
jgi:hypothetical protein